MGTAGSSRTLIIAGTGLALDIDFTNNVVGKVALSFPEAPASVTKHAEKAGKILLENLQLGPDESQLTKMLDKFAGNLERLAALDKLSVTPGLNCHEAITGIYESLKRLHEWEVERLKEEEGMARKDEEYLSRAVLCTKSGRPSMHVHGRVGLSFDYWQEQHLYTNPTNPEFFSISIECAPSTALVYPAVRVSTNWISENIQKTNPTATDLIEGPTGPILDWQDPPPTLLPSNSEDSSKNDEQQKIPDVIFTAKFRPPILVPLELATSFHNSVDSPLTSFHPQTFDALLLPPLATEPPIEAGEARTIIRTSTITVRSDNGEKVERKVRNTLFLDKSDYAHTISELPFSHPKQLVALLPVLRQYTFFNTLLTRTFTPSTQEEGEEKKADRPGNKLDAFEAFMSQSTTPLEPEPERKLDVTFTLVGNPRIQVVFPCGEKKAQAEIEILPGGQAAITWENVLSRIAGKGASRDDMARWLEVSEDLGIWAEFIRRKVGV
jgi:hypothetical protein